MHKFIYFHQNVFKINFEMFQCRCLENFIVIVWKWIKGHKNKTKKKNKNI